jgi:hypothetical protein
VLTLAGSTKNYTFLLCTPMKTKSIFFLVVLLASCSMAMAQGSGPYGSGIKIPIGVDSSKYLRVISWHQVWVRHNDNNAPSLHRGAEEPSTFDIGLRRSRILFLAQISDDFLILSHFGINNQNAVSGGVLGLDGKKPQLYVHDAWTEYRVVPKKLYMGAGLHYWNGISRMSSASTLNFLGLDSPIFPWATIEATDQFARMLGVYAKGQLGKFNYRTALNSPFLTNTGGAIREGEALYSPESRTMVKQGYFSFDFLEQESNFLPYYVGSYLGSKKVFNIGAGFLHHPEAMWSLQQGDTLHHDMNLFSVDTFLDLPLSGGKKGAITAYAAQYFYDFGPNNVRYVGIMNPAQGGGALRGNSVPLIGTGAVSFAQAGYLVPGSILKDKVKLQPYASLSHARFEGIRNERGTIVPVNIYDVGLNFLVEGHHAKITINYRPRPDFSSVSDIRRRSEITLQSVIYL